MRELADQSHFEGLSVVGVTLVTLLLGSTPAVSSPAPDGGSADQQAHDGSVSLTMSDPNSLAAVSLVCDVSIDDPHYSNGPQAVIAKVRYTCTGTLQGELKVRASIYRYAPGTVGPYAPKATNNENPVVFGGASGTVYVPAEGAGGIACKKTDWYYAYADVTLVAGLQVDYGDARSNTVHPQRCS